MQQDRIYPQIHDQADQLMNALFLEVESALAIAPNLPTAEDIKPLQSAIVPFTPSNTLAEPLIEPEPLVVAAKDLEPNAEVLPNFLLGAALTSAIFAVLITSVSFYLSGLRVTKPVVASLPESPLADDLRRSLAEVKDTKPEETNPAIPPVKPIYIPIYQAPVQTSGQTNPVEPESKPVPVSQPPQAKESSPTRLTSPKGNYTLVGVLDLGDRSTAMFDIDGSVQSIQVGNPVADSGWQLSRVGSQEVFLKKGSQNATVAVGQKF